MKRILIVVALSLSSSAWAATAYWTGDVEYVTTITGRQGVSCEYNLYGETFWKTFLRSSCPLTIEVM